MLLTKVLLIKKACENIWSVPEKGLGTSFQENHFLVELTDLDGKSVRSHSYVPTHAILKKHLWYVAFLKHCDVLSQLARIHLFSPPLITLFLNSLLKLLYSTFYLLSFAHIVTFSFSCSCYLLNTPTHS